MRTAKLLLALTLFIILIVWITTLFSEEDDLFDCISDPYCPIFDEPVSKAKKINI